LIESANTSLVIDTGPDFRYQMLRQKVKKLDAVLFTHSHKDHIAGLDDVKAFNFLSKKSIDIYADHHTEEALKREFYYVFGEAKYPGIPELNLHRITLEPFVIGDIPVIPIAVWHLKMPVLGFRFGSFTYITDANRIDETEKEKIRGSSVLAINALRKQKHVSHFTLGEAIDLVDELKIPTAYLTHLSHQMGLHYDIEAELPDGVHLAFDQLQLP
jgi:phosphoribosyl 1,2-cyclic phosphate phosphodiesterase